MPAPVIAIANSVRFTGKLTEAELVAHYQAAPAHRLHERMTADLVAAINAQIEPFETPATRLKPICERS